MADEKTSPVGPDLTQGVALPDFVDGRLVERAPEPDAVRYLGSVIAAAAAMGGDAAARVGFVDGEFIAVQPLMVRGSSVPVGWLAVTRAL